MRQYPATNFLITFGGEQYDGTTRDIVENGPHMGADGIFVYHDVWLTKQPFYHINQWLWDHPHKRGFGWYAWKPFVIIDALSKVDDDDVVLYIDADTRPIADFSVLFDECRRAGGIMVFRAETYMQRNWCKRDCYMVMGQDKPEYWDAPHAVARFMLFQKGKWTATQFLMEWLTYCVNPLATTFDPSVLGKPELDGFIEHRTEQAIFTNLAHKYKLKLYREACEGGNGIQRDQELYPQLFEQRNPNTAGGTNPTLEVRGSRYGNV